jgi:hypothetical protein
MSDGQTYPLFIWIVVGVILLMLIIYAIRKGEVLKEVKFPGGSAVFELAPKEQLIGCQVSFDLPSRQDNPPASALHAEAVLHIGGTSTTLTVNRSQPFATTDIKMPQLKRASPTDGDNYYVYRLEISETFPPSDSTPYIYKVERSSDGKIIVNDGDGFKVGITCNLYPQTRTYEWKATIQKILSEQEKSKQYEEFRDAMKQSPPVAEGPYKPLEG